MASTCPRAANGAALTVAYDALIRLSPEICRAVPDEASAKYRWCSQRIPFPVWHFIAITRGHRARPWSRRECLGRHLSARRRMALGMQRKLSSATDSERRRVEPSRPFVRDGPREAGNEYPNEARQRSEDGHWGIVSLADGRARGISAHHTHGAPAMRLCDSAAGSLLCRVRKVLPGDDSGADCGRQQLEGDRNSLGASSGRRAGR